jgi:hypothetical protein
MTSSSVNESNGGKDAERNEDSGVVKEIAKRKERSEARKRQHAAKKLKEAQGLGIEVGDEVVYCRLMLEPLDGSRQTNIGLIRVNSGRVTFLASRAQIMREISSFWYKDLYSFTTQSPGSIEKAT